MHSEIEVPLDVFFENLEEMFYGWRIVSIFVSSKIYNNSNNNNKYLYSAFL